MSSRAVAVPAAPARVAPSGDVVAGLLSPVGLVGSAFRLLRRMWKSAVSACGVGAATSAVCALLTVRALMAMIGADLTDLSAWPWFFVSTAVPGLGLCAVALGAAVSTASALRAAAGTQPRGPLFLTRMGPAWRCAVAWTVTVGVCIVAVTAGRPLLPSSWSSEISRIVMMALTAVVTWPFVVTLPAMLGECIGMRAAMARSCRLVRSAPLRSFTVHVLTAWGLPMGGCALVMRVGPADRMLVVLYAAAAAVVVSVSAVALYLDLAARSSAVTAPAPAP